MAGLNLGMSAGFTVPAPALPPSYANTKEGGTISSRAYGIAGASSPTAGRETAALGSVAVGIVATVALTWLWWTLPH